MRVENNLVLGFSEPETVRIVNHLKRLFSYLVPERFAIVGGLAIRYHLVSHHIPYPKRAFNDLDLIAEDLSVISPKVTKDFLVYHVHRQNSHFYFALVDPVSKTKVDIFDYSLPSKKLIKVKFQGQIIQLQSTEDQLVKTILDLQRISPKTKVDPKQFLDARLLLQIANLKEAEAIWREKKQENLPKSLITALKRAEEIKEKHPEWLKEKPFRKAVPYVCRECTNTSGFPLTPMEKIYRILGYAE